MDWKTEYEDGKGLETDVQIQHDSYQDTCWPSVETDKPILKFTQHYKEPQGAQATLNKKNKVKRGYTSLSENLLQSNSDEDSVVLA